MKKISILFSIFLSTWTFSQLRYSDQSVVGIGGGITGNKGFYINADYTRFIGDKGWAIKGNLVFTNQRANIDNVPGDEYINIKQYMLFPNAQYTFEQWNLEPFFISVFGGGMVGYEVVNQGNNFLPTSGIISEQLKNNFIYGGNLGILGEVELDRDWYYFIKGEQIYRMNSTVGKFSFMIGTGIRYYF